VDIIWSITGSIGTEAPFQQFFITQGWEGSGRVSKVKGISDEIELSRCNLFIVPSGRSVPSIPAATDNPDPAF